MPHPLKICVYNSIMWFDVRVLEIISDPGAVRPILKDREHDLLERCEAFQTACHKAYFKPFKRDGTCLAVGTRATDSSEKSKVRRGKLERKLEHAVVDFEVDISYPVDGVSTRHFLALGPV